MKNKSVQSKRELKLKLFAKMFCRNENMRYLCSEHHRKAVCHAHAPNLEHAPFAFPDAAGIIEVRGSSPLPPSSRFRDAHLVAAPAHAPKTANLNQRKIEQKKWRKKNRKRKKERFPPHPFPTKKEKDKKKDDKTTTSKR